MGNSSSTDDFISQFEPYQDLINGLIEEIQWFADCTACQILYQITREYKSFERLAQEDSSYVQQFGVFVDVRSRFRALSRNQEREVLFYLAKCDLSRDYYTISLVRFS